MDTFVTQLGRLHPLLVHLPIGSIFLLVAFEIYFRFRKESHSGFESQSGAAIRTFILILSTTVAILSAGFGWLLSQEGGYETNLLSQHQFFGFAVAGLSLLLLLIHLAKWKRAYLPVLAVVTLTLVLAGHFGGSLTHGSDYLDIWFSGDSADPVAEAVAAEPDPAKVLVFEDAIQPLLETRCLSCHGPEKSKGDLRLDSIEAIQRGGKEGPSIMARNPSESPLIQRILLPITEKKHMPPKGKPQLTDAEVALFEWWVQNHAHQSIRIADAHPPPTVETYLSGLFPSLETPVPDREEILEAANTIARQLNISIRPLSAREPWLEVSARLRSTEFGDSELAQLAPIAPAIQRLDLGTTAVTDKGLMHLKSMEQLRQLQLDRTGISDAAMENIAVLPRLEYLNIFNTEITDEGILALTPLTELRSLYAWNTRISPEAVQALSEQLVDQRMIARWQADIDELQRRIENERFSANLGESLPTGLEIPEAEPLPEAAKEEE